MSEGRRGMVLAINYELVSDATRGLESLRRLEELTPESERTSAQEAEGRELRKQLNILTVLPAIALWRVTGRGGETRASEEEIDEKYREFLRGIGQ